MKSRRLQKSVATVARKKLRTRLLALEPRILFDGVALVDPVTLLAEPAPTADQKSTEPAPQPEAPAAPTIAHPADESLAPSEPAPAEGREIAFYDPRHPELAAILAELGPDVELVALDPARDGVEQIRAVLAEGEPVSAIHILGHGDPGAISLGNTSLSLDNLDARAPDLAQWAAAFTADADILLYGCDVAAGERGQSFVQRLAELTRADVAASTDLTGATALGGDWELEQRTGSIEAQTFALEGFDGVLAAPSGSAQTASVGDGATKHFGGETFGFSDADGHTLSAIIITALPNAGDGILSFNGTPVTLNQEISAAQLSNLVYTAANKTAAYSASFQFKVKDSSGTSSASASTYTLNVSAANDAPTAVADNATIAEDTASVSGNALANDTDADINDTKTVTALTGGSLGQALTGSHGSFTLNADGSYSYVLDNTSEAVQALGLGQTLTETFTYQMRDAAGSISSATVTVTITGTNDAPVATTTALELFAPIPENASDAENSGTTVSALLTTLDGVALATDADTGDALGIAVYGSSTTGGMSGSWQYQLNGSGTWAAFTPSLNAAVLIPGDAKVRFVVDNNVPDAQQSGSATLQYYAWDGHGTAGSTIDAADGNRGGTSAVSLNALSLTVNVAPRNDAPVLSQNAITLAERGTGSIILTGNLDPASTTDNGKHLYLFDPDNTNDQLMYRLEALPTLGKLVKNNVEMGVGSLFTQADVANGLIKYTYTGGELSANATDSFRVSLRDGAGGVIGADGAAGTNQWATIALTITDVNAQISAGNTSHTTSEYMNPGDHVDLTGLKPSDADAAGSPAGYPRMAVVGLPAQGTLQYWNGSAYVNMTADHLQGGATPLWFTEAQLTTNPLRYIPVAGEPSAYGAQVQFNVFVDDGGRAGNPGLATNATSTVTINVTPVNDAPAPVTNPISVERDSANNVIGIDKLTATDEDSLVSKRVYTISNAPDRGYLTLNGVRIGVGATFTQADLDANRLAYTHEGAVPDSDPNTYEDHFEFTVNDGDGGLANGRLDINVLPKDIPPGGEGGTLTRTVAEGVFQTIDTVSLSGSTSYTLTALPVHGTLYLNGVALGLNGIFTQADVDAGKVIYVSDGNEPSGYAPTPYHDSFSVNRSGGTVTGSSSFTLVVTPVDDAPIINQTTPNTVTIEEHNTGGGSETANPDGNGVPSLVGVSNAIKLTTDNLSGVDVDTANEQLYYVLADAPDGGSLKLWNGTAWVALNAGDRFNVTAVAQGKVAYFHDPNSELRNDSIQVYLTDGAVVQAGDVQISGGTISELGTKTVSDGTNMLSLAKGSISRSPTRTVSFTINNVNDAPVAAGATIAVDEGTGETGSTPPTNPASWKILTTAILSVSDSDDTVADFNNGTGQGYYELISLPTRGKVQFSSDGTTWVDVSANQRFSHADLAAGKLRYAHDGSETTVDSFQYRAVDPNGGVGNTATVDVNVRPVNDAPKVTGTLTIDGGNSVPEGGARKITPAMLGIDLASTDPDNTANQVQYRINSVAGLRGSLYLGDPTTGATAKTLGVGSAVTLQQILDGKLWYQHDGTDPFVYGNTASFDFQVSDSSGMAEPTGTFTIAILPVNDKPAATNLSGGSTFTEGDTGAAPNVVPIRIDNSVSLVDTDLANNNADFRGGHLRLSYASGGSAFDQLGVANVGSGAGQIGISGSNITWGGVLIGTIDATENGQNGNALRINFTSGGANPALTAAAIDALMEALSFSHTQYDNAVTGTRTLNYTLVDGGGTASYTDDRGRTFAGQDTWSGSATVNVIAANDRPVLTPNTSGGSINLGTIGEDEAAPAGFQVGSFLSAVNGAADASHSGIADVDTGAALGIAVTGLTNAAGGKWQYSADGISWTDVGTVSASNALLLTASDYLRFLPDAKDGGTATVTYKAWDQTSGTARAKADTTANAQTSAFSAATDTAAVTVTPSNDAPTLGGPNSVTAVEDTVFSFTGANALSVGDVDSGTNLISLTLTFTGSGSFQFSGATSGIFTDAGGTTSQATWSGFTNAQTLTVYGTAANLNTMLGKLQYNPAAHVNDTNLAAQAVTAQPQVKIDVDDQGYGVNNADAGSGLTATKTVAISITPTNDAPTLNLSGNSLTIGENTGSTAIGIDVTLADPNDINNSIYGGSTLPTIVIKSQHGNLSFGTATGVTIVSGNGTRTLTLRGSMADLTAAMSAGNHQVSYQPDANFSGTDTISYTLNDNGNVGGGNLTATGTINVTVTGINNAPSFTGLDATPTFAENGAAVVLDANATLNDDELGNYSNWNNAVLTIQRNGGANADDVFGVTGSGSTGVNFNGSNIRIGTTTVGTFTNANGALAITFNGNATNDRVNQVLQALTYGNTNNNPPGNVAIAYTINDGDTDPDRTGNGQGTGGALIGSGQIVVTLTATNDAPALTGINANSYTEDGTAIVLAPGATPSDPELSWMATQNGDWGGARLTISRNGGASAEDVFGASGTLGALAAGQNLVLNGATIGTVTANGGGTLALSFNDGVTTAQAESVMRQITYANTRQALGAGANANVTLNWVLEDGDTDPGRVNDQGTGGNLTVSVAQTISLTGVNDAPTLGDTALTMGQTEDAGTPSGAVGSLVSSLTGGVGDVDTGAVNGVAVIGADSTLGTWFYSTDGGTTWTVLPTVAANDALLLRSTDRVYFRPTANVNGEVSAGLTVRAWDQSNIGTHAAGSKADTTINGGATAYSTATDAVRLAVTAVNDAPTRTAPSVGITVSEDNTNPTGDTVGNLFNPVFNDATDNQSAFTAGSAAHALAGVAIVGNAATAAQGTWQYNSGSGWTNVPSVALNNAFLLKATDSLRFVPAANFHGTPGALTVRLADSSAAATVSATRADLSGAATGGTTRYSDLNNAVTLTVAITAVNDAPSASGATNLTATSEDATSTARSASSIAASLTYGDSTDDRSAVSGGGNTASAQTAIAIVGNAATAGQGAWQYTLDGANWNDVSTTVANGTAIVLSLADANHQLRFVPAADYNGTPGALSVRAADGTWNGTTGVVDISSAVGATNAWSASTASVGIVVNPVNDAPAVNNLDGTPTYTEGADTAGDRNLLGAPVVLDATVAIADIELVTQGVDNFGGSMLTIGRDNGAGGFVANAQDVFGFNSTTVSVAAGVISVSGNAVADVTSNGGGQLVITFRSGATSSQVNTVAGSITYANASDTPPGHVDLRYSFNDDNQLGAQGSGGALTGDATIRVTIVATNDPPLAVDDSAAIAEDSATVTGNVITGPGTDSDPEADALTVTAVRTGTEAAGTGTAGTPGQALAGSYGSLTLNADGSYSYALDNNNAAVNQLKNGETLIEVYTYTISDGNGGTDIAQLTITINGNTDAAPTISANDGNGAATGHATVTEAGLTSSGDTGETTTGALTLQAADGLASITVGGTTISLAALNALGTTPVTVDTVEGTLVLTGFTATAAIGGVPTAGTVDYSYTLKARQDHTGLGESTDAIALVVTDQGGASANGTLSVRIVDDVPTAGNDAASITENAVPNTVSGNLATNDRIGADTTATPVSGVSFGGTGRTVGTSFATTYGSIVVGADGSYTYTLDNANPAVNALSPASAPLIETVSYTISDADGDTSTATLTITISGSNDAPVLVDTARTITQLEDAAAPVGTVGTLVSDLIGAGGSSDVDTGALARGIALTGTDTSLGSWHVSTDGGTTWNAVGAVSNGAALLLGPNARIAFVPNADRNTSDGATGASAPIAAGLSFRAWDRSSGVEGTTADASSNGGSTAFSAATDTVQLIVTPVNDAPAVIGLDTISVNANAGNPYIPGAGPVVIDPDVSFADRELGSERNSWNGATLTIERKGGASTDDLFGASGSLSLAGGNVVVGGTTIGTVTNGAGTLVLSFNANATTALVSEAARNITYANAQLTPPYSSITLAWTLDDQNPNTTGSGSAGSGHDQGNGGALRAVAEIVLSLNQPPVANADAATAVERGGLANATPGVNPIGNVLANDTDPDPVDTKTVVTAGTFAGTYGTLTLNADGSYAYVLNNNHPAVEALRTAADTLNETFNYTMRDAAGLTSSSALTITVQGANDTPAAANDTAEAVESGGINNGIAGTDPTGNVLVNDTDIDAGDTKTVTSIGKFAGKYGTLELNADGGYVYRLDNTNPVVDALRPGESLAEVFTYTMRDTAGATSTATLSLTIRGADDAYLVPQPPPPPPAPPAEQPPSVAPVPSGQPPVGGGSGGSSGSGLAFFNAAQDAHIEDGSQRLTLRTTTESQQGANNQNTGNESRKLESTDRGFPVERMKGESNPGTLVDNQQKGGDKLFVFKGINNTFGEVGVGIDYRVPREAFGHTDPNAIVQLEAGLADGNPLPEWMDFDPTSGAFSGRPPADAERVVEVKVIARDNDGREATTTFRLEIQRDSQGDNQSSDAEPAAPNEKTARVGKDVKEFTKRGAVPFADQIKLARKGDGLLDRILAFVETDKDKAKGKTPAADKTNVEKTSA